MQTGRAWYHIAASGLPSCRRPLRWPWRWRAAPPCPARQRVMPQRPARRLLAAGPMAWRRGVARRPGVARLPTVKALEELKAPKVPKVRRALRRAGLRRPARVRPPVQPRRLPPHRVPASQPRPRGPCRMSAQPMALLREPPRGAPQRELLERMVLLRAQRVTPARQQAVLPPVPQPVRPTLPAQRERPALQPQVWPVLPAACWAVPRKGAPAAWPARRSRRPACRPRSTM